VIEDLTNDIGRKDIWIFGSRKGQFYDDNSKYLYLYVLNHKTDIYPVWITKNKIVYERLKLEKLPVALVGSEAANYLIENAKCAFINIIHSDLEKSRLSENTKIIQLWHGTPMKFNDISQFNERYDLVSLASSLFLKEQALAPHDMFNFQITGYPRNDFLLNDDIPQMIEQDTLDKLQNKKVITFLPTYSEERDERKIGDKRGKSYDIWGELNFEKLNTMLVENNALFVIKLHPLQSPSHCDVHKKLEESANVLIIDSTDPFADVYAYLKYTDIMITDYSSVLFDYLLLNRPVIFSCFDLESYSQNRQLRFDYQAITPGVKTASWSEVLTQIDWVLKMGDDQFAGERIKVNNTFNFYQDNKSCERIYQSAKML
jgi:CDP-glycerol glycerophosphotransferase (TagB/SpsB family)